MQKNTQFISRIIASTMLFLALAHQSRQIAQETPAPLSLFLLRRPCVSTGIGNWDRRTEDVSVGRAVYTSRLFMGPGNSSAAMTCKLQPNEPGVIFQKLRLGFGMRDNDEGSPAATVNVYLDGVKAQTVSRTVSPAKAAMVSLDVTTVNNVSIEVVCTNQSRYCDRVYFWQAELEYPPLPKK